MKSTLRGIGRKTLSLLAYLLVISVLFIGAANAQGGGFPTKPKFADVRIGVNNFTDCESVFGVGECDLSIERSVYIEGALLALNGLQAPIFSSQGHLTLESLDIMNIDSLNAIQITSSAGFIQLDAALDIFAIADDDVTIQGAGDVLINGSQITNTSSTSIIESAGSQYRVNAVGGGDELLIRDIDFVVDIGGGADELTIDGANTALIAATQISLEAGGANLVAAGGAVAVTDTTLSYGSSAISTNLTGSTNDLSPFGSSKSTLLSITLTGSQTLTGLVPPITDQSSLLFLRNDDGTDTLTITHEDTNSVAANRFHNPGRNSFVLPPATLALCARDSRDDRWHCSQMTATRMAWGNFTVGAGSCTTNVSGENIASCARNGTGDFTVTFTVPYSVNPACTFTNISGTLNTVITAVTTSTVVVNLTDAAGVLQNGTATMTCMGR